MFQKFRGIEKLQKVLINDKHFQPARFNELMRSEIFKCLSGYMEITPENILTNLSVEDNGEYVLRCKIKSKRLKIMGLLPREV